jgi:hypothetical protein
MANDRCGSVASHRSRHDVHGMSAMAPKPTETVPRSKPSVSAITGCEQSQQRNLLFDFLVDTPEQGRGSDAQRLGDLDSGGDACDHYTQPASFIDHGLISAQPCIYPVGVV